MALYATVWTRPGHANFGQVIAEPPTRFFTLHDGAGLPGDGSLTLPSRYARFDDILLIDQTSPALSVNSLVRVFDDSTTPHTFVGEWRPRTLLPASSKDDPTVRASGFGMNWALNDAVVEAYDWDGSADFHPTFPDWIYGGRNILINPSFETQDAQPQVYWLLLDATAGTFTLSDGTDTTSAIPFNVGARTLEQFIETDIAAITDVLVTPLTGLARAYLLDISATGGTFTITHGASTTAALAFNIGAAALESAIEGLTGITDVTVTSTADGFEIALVNPATAVLSIDTSNLTGGSAVLSVDRAADGFQIECVDPPFGITLTINTGGLTGTGALMLIESGFFIPTGWTKSQMVSVGVPREFGVYDVFEPSMAQAHDGVWSLAIDPGPVNSRIEAFAGAQQVVNVNPGGLYQASIWVRPTTAGQTYRLVIRSLNEDILQTLSGADARTDVSPPPNVWTQVLIPDVVIGGQTQVIFRFANTQLSGDPTLFYVDSAAFNEGEAAASVGHILLDLYDDAVSDHAPGRIMWDDDANPGTPWLTPDFTATQDSNGAAWDRDDLSAKIWMRMTYFQMMDQFSQVHDYEWRIVPDDIEAGSWLWQVYNPGTMETDYTAAANPAIQGGSRDTQRQIMRVLPEATDVFMEGLQRLTARSGLPTLRGALGRAEGAMLDRELPTQDAVTDAATVAVGFLVSEGVSYAYKLTDPQSRPLVAYRIGDRLTVHDPPEVNTAARLADVEVVVTPDGEEYDVQFVEPEL